MAGEKRMTRAEATRFMGARAEPLPPGALYRLLAWLSPAYPVGAFAYSSGIEWAVASGDIADTATLRAWIESLLAVGSGLTDAVLFCHSHRAFTSGDDAAAAKIAELASALVATRERFQETTNLGRSFLEVTHAAWPCAALATLSRIWPGPPAYPVAVAAACAGHSIALAPALQALLTAMSSNWLSAGIRLIPLGHTDGQRLLRALEPAVATATQTALTTPLENIGAATLRADIAGARHETQYTRLFRS